MKPELVYIIILNWNGCEDTTACINSLIKLDFAYYRIIVCDNNSQDLSIETIKKWCKNRSINPIYERYDGQARNIFLNDHLSQEISIGLIQTGHNLGFAGGNNVGLRYALQDDRCKYIWILNNDTVVTPTSLSALVAKCQTNPKIGICGSKILYFDRPSIVQAWGGGTYNKWTGVAKEFGEGTSADFAVDVELVDNSIDYIVGASMLVSVDFVNDIGLMNEEYFLYHEEIDWIARAIGKYFIAYADDSIIYHKHGGSTGSTPKQTTALADYYSTRGILIYTKKYVPIALPTIYLKLIYAIFQRFRRKQYDRIPWLLALMLNREYKFSDLKK
jgi:GT2 family glycosyltransferase